jgi:alcohol dehydrogenase (cytochrome c)
MGGVQIADYRAGYSSTGAPLVIGNKIIVGIAGGIFGTRGFIDAYDVNSGKQLWRFWTVPEAGQPGNESWSGDSWKRGGGATWMTGTFDPESNLLFWGTGNPAPVLAGEMRQGDNLYTNCLLAIDPETGKMKWYFQFTPHDTRDWDSAHIPVLADITISGTLRKVVMVANRNGFFYVLDRTTGQLLLAKPFVKKLTWAKGIAADGKPIVNPGSNQPSPQGTLICPDMDGGTNWMSPSFSPATGLFYVTAREDCATYFSWESHPKVVEGQFYFGGDAIRKRGSGRGALRAIDPMTGDIRWEVEYPQPSMAGVLSTASGLVFTGDMDGNVLAFDAKTGKNLWHFAAGGPVYAAPTTVLVSGKQYLFIPAGGSLFAFAIR